MANSKTFSMKPVSNLLKRYVQQHDVVIDPFARDSTWGTITNDLNPKTRAMSHQFAHKFCDDLLTTREDRSTYGFAPNHLFPGKTTLDPDTGKVIAWTNTGYADVVLFDPPYSPRQIKECYNGIGIPVYQSDTQMWPMYKKVKVRLKDLLKDNGYAICFGWNSCGFGKMLGFEMIEIMLINHGANHYDTIVTVEKKSPEVRHHVVQTVMNFIEEED